MLTEAEAVKLAKEIFDDPQFTEFRTERQTSDQIIDQERTANIPDFYEDSGIEEYRSFEAKYASNLDLQELSTANPVFEIRSRAIEASRRDGAQNFENFISRWWVVENDLFEPPFLLVCSDQDTRGIGCYRLDLRSGLTEDGKYDIWPAKPPMDGETPKAYSKAVDEYKLRTPTPFTLEAVDILCCAWMSDADGVAYFVEKSERPINLVLQTYRLTMGRDGRIYQLGQGQPVERADTDPKTLTFTELCTRDHIYHIIKQPKANSGGKQQSDVIGMWPNPFGGVRYVLAPARVRNRAEITKRFRPLIEEALDIAKLDTDFGTMRKYAAYRAGYPVEDLVHSADKSPYLDPETGKARIYIHPMKPVDYDLPAGTELKPRLGAGIDLDKAMAYVELLRQRYGRQDVIAGATAGEREAAWSLAVRGEQAKHVIDPALRGQKVALKEIARLIAHCIKFSIKEPVLIWAVVKDDLGREKPKQIKCRPEDIEEDFDIDVDMNYRSTAIQIAQKESLRRDRIEGQISEYRYQEEAIGLDDPSQEQSIIAVERLEKATDAMALWEVIDAVITAVSAEVGAPPPDPMKIAALRGAVFGVATPQEAQARRPASPVRATGMEAPPTPEGQRLL